MRLTALDARFFGEVDPVRRSSHFQETLDGAQGVMFQCPLCAVGKPVSDDGRGVQGAHYIRVCFSNPRNAVVAPPEYDDNPRWQMSGTSLEDLTLAPSINLDVPGNGDGGCKWHGYVTNGAAQ